jgi:hypothetical protein
MDQIRSCSHLSRTRVNRLIDDGDLRTKIPKTRPGVKREFTRENALEICFIGALLSLDIPMAIVKTAVWRWLKQEREGTLPAYWAFGNRLGFFCDIEFDEPTRTVESLMLTADGGPNVRTISPNTAATGVFVVNLAEVVARVDKISSQLDEAALSDRKKAK